MSSELYSESNSALLGMEASAEGFYHLEFVDSSALLLHFNFIKVIMGIPLSYHTNSPYLPNTVLFQIPSNNFIYLSKAKSWWLGCLQFKQLVHSDIVH